MHPVTFVAAVFAVSLLLPAVLLWLLIIPWKRLPEDPWTERARRLHPIRLASQMWSLVVPFSAVVASRWLCPGAPLTMVVAAAILGSVLSGWPLQRAVHPGTSLREWIFFCCHHSAFTLILVFLVVAFASAMPASWSLEQLAWSVGFLACVLGVSLGVLYRLQLLLGFYQPAGPRLAGIARDSSGEAGIPFNHARVFPSATAFAAALPIQRELLFSSSLADDCDDEELRAVCRHELSHLNEGKAVLALRVFQLPLTLLPLTLAPAFVASLGKVGFVIPLFLWVLLQGAFRRIFLRFEHLADDAACQKGECPAYARALEKIHRRNLLPAALPTRAPRTHPDLYDRMTAAGLPPSYPRPSPPETSNWMVVLGQILVGCTMLAWLSLKQ